MNPFEEGLRRYLKPEQLTKIRSVKIGIGGAGGLGSNAAMILVRGGFKHLEIIDYNVIDASNLNRQQYFIDEIGQPKVAILHRRLLDINTHLQLTAHKIKWTPDIGG